MISYSEYKLLKEDTPPAGAPPTGPGGSGGPPPAGAPPALGGSDPMPPPGFGGGISPSMGGPDIGGMGGMGGPSGAADLKPSGLKSSNVWDVLEKLIKDQK